MFRQSPGTIYKWVPDLHLIRNPPVETHCSSTRITRIKFCPAPMTWPPSCCMFCSISPDFLLVWLVLSGVFYQQDFISAVICTSFSYSASVTLLLFVAVTGATDNVRNKTEFGKRLVGRTWLSFVKFCLVSDACLLFILAPLLRRVRRNTSAWSFHNSAFRADWHDWSRMFSHD